MAQFSSVQSIWPKTAPQIEGPPITEKQRIAKKRKVKAKGSKDPGYKWYRTEINIINAQHCVLDIIIADLRPRSEHLRFTPNPAVRPVNSGATIHKADVADPINAYNSHHQLR